MGIRRTGFGDRLARGGLYRRRTTALGVAAALLAAARAGLPGAQGIARPKPAVVGVLMFTPMGAAYLAGLREGLRAHGYTEGTNLTLEVRAADGNVEAAQRLAEELVRLPVALIVAVYTPAALAARRATSTLPIVMAPAGDPVASGLVASLSRPGGNVTGFSNVVAELSGKRLELLRAVVPAVARVGLVVNGADPLDRAFVEETRTAATKANLDIVVYEVRQADALGKVFAAIARDRVQAVIVAGNLPAPAAEVAKQALRHRLPSISLVSGYPEAGGLMSYGADLGDIAYRAAGHVATILRGAQPESIPVERPVHFDLVVNAKTAKSLGLALSPAIRVSATRVIE